MASRKIKSLLGAAASFAGLFTLGAMSDAQAQALATAETPTAEAAAEVATDAETVKSALFQAFPALDSEAARNRLAEFQKNPKLAAALERVSQALDAPNVKVKDIEADVLTLIAGRKLEDAEVSLDALMRDYYLIYVHGLDEQKSVTAVASLLERRERVVTEAAFGQTSANRGLSSPSSIRPVRR